MLQFPTELGDLDANVLNPRNAWPDKHAYDSARRKLAKKFIKNYDQYITPGLPNFSPFGPRIWDERPREDDNEEWVKTKKEGWRKVPRKSRKNRSAR